MVSNKAMSIANTDASVINKLANGKPPVPAKQRVKQRTIHVNLTFAGQSGKRCSEWNVP